MDRRGTPPFLPRCHCYHQISQTTQANEAESCNGAALRLPYHMHTSATLAGSAELRTRELAKDILPAAISCATVLVARHRAYSYRAAVLHRVYVFNHLWKLSSFGTMIRLDPNTCLFACLSCNLERDGLTVCFLELHETLYST
jgi:hypothetical protein